MLISAMLNELRCYWRVLLSAGVGGLMVAVLTRAFDDPYFGLTILLFTGVLFVLLYSLSVFTLSDNRERLYSIIPFGRYRIFALRLLTSLLMILWLGMIYYLSSLAVQLLVGGSAWAGFYSYLNTALIAYVFNCLMLALIDFQRLIADYFQGSSSYGLLALVAVLSAICGAFAVMWVFSDAEAALKLRGSFQGPAFSLTMIQLSILFILIDFVIFTFRRSCDDPGRGFLLIALLGGNKTKAE